MKGRKRLNHEHATYRITLILSPSLHLSHTVFFGELWVVSCESWTQCSDGELILFIFPSALERERERENESN